MNEEYQPPETAVAAREILEALWDLQDLHRELIVRAEFLCKSLEEKTSE